MLTNRDKARLEKVDPRWLRVLTRAANDNPGRFFVDAHCARDVAEEQKFIADGTSKLKDPYKSLHVIGPKRPLSLAVDLYPTGYDAVAHIPLSAYADVADIIKRAAAAEGVEIDWGYDLWKWDRPHFQLRHP